MTRKILIDTDTASDDAVALIMALRSPAVEVLAITVVAGNVSVQQGTRNALFTAELCASPVPVFSGAAAPLIRPLEDAAWFHGRDGLGDHGYQPQSRQAEDGFAVDAMIETIAAHPGLEIITLGPLTNLALALEQWPQLPSHVSRCVLMGGAPGCEGNVSPAAEYNFWADPEAARVVLRSRLPIELAGWQLSRGAAVVDGEEIAQIQELGTKFAEFTLRANDFAAQAYRRQTGEEGISLPDPIAMAILLDPALSVVSGEHYVDAQVDSGLTRGMSVVDKLGVAEDPRNRAVWSEVLKRGRKHRVIWEMDVPGWKRALFRALA